MAVTSLSSKSRPLQSLFHALRHRPFCSLAPSPHTSHSASDPPLPELVNDISRVLSDHRNPHDDLEHSLTAFSTQISTNLVEQVLKRCKNLGFSAHRFFLWAKKLPGFEHSFESYRILVDVLGCSKQFALLWDFLREMKDSKNFELNPEIFFIVFRGYSRANLPGDAIRAFSRMSEFGIEPSTADFDQLLYVLCKRKHVRHAQQFFDKAKVEFEPSVKSYSVLIRGWGDIGEVNEARKLFDEMLRRGCSLDVQAWNSLLEALCEGGNVDEAYNILGEMGPKGFDPDACTYSIFIRAYNY